MRISEATRDCRGFTYVGVLLAVALLGVGLAAVGEMWHTTRQRERERELLFIGDAYRRAIAAYYDSTPSGGARRYPETLHDLLIDRRYPVVRRYLRKIYPDPMTGASEWGIVKGPGNTIKGVYSLSRQKPVKRKNFADAFAHFTDAGTFADWRFVHDAAESAPQASLPGSSTAIAGATRAHQPLPSAAIIDRGALQFPVAAP